jgi:hypothetical protein
MHNLDRIKNDYLGPLAFNQLGNDFRASLCGDTQVVHRQLQSLRAQGKLLQGFLSGDVKDALMLG